MTLKELREILRDRRTTVTLVLMPLFIYPLMSVAARQFLVTQATSSRAPTYTLGVRDRREARFFQKVLEQGGIELVDLHARPAIRPDGSSLPAVKLGINPRLEERLQEYEIDVGLRLLAPSSTDISLDPDRDLAIKVELLYNPRSTAGREAAAFIDKHLKIASERLLETRLKRLGVTQPALPLRSVRRAIDDSDSTSLSGSVSIAAVIPFILIMMTVTGAVYPAIDLTAGERERGTLEVLMAAPIPRVGILLAKYVTVLAVALLTAAANLLAMTITVAVSGLGPLLFGESGISAGVIAAVFGLLLLFAAFFSAVLLVITSSARSFKEAQAYLIPLMLASLAPGMLSLLPDVELSGVLLVTPLANIVLLGRDLIAFKAGAPATLIVVTTTLLYAGAAIGVAARIFGDESVLYSSQGTWSDFFRRPQEPQSAPTVIAGIVCLAVLFPAFFLLLGLVGHVGDEIAYQLVVGSLITAFLFGGIPLAACRMRRIPIAPAFRISRSAFTVTAAVTVVGLSFWVINHEVVLVIQDWRDVTLDPKLVTLFKEYADKLRLLPVPAVVLALAVVPAFFEEAFFRGYLFAALRSRMTPAATIVATAIAFGLFHVIAPNPLASERLVSSALTGLVLGWVRWRTGSLLPGIVLHSVHNSFLILVAYYEPQLQAAGLGLDQEQHLPGAWLALGATTACTALATLYAVTRRDVAREEASPARID